MQLCQQWSAHFYFLRLQGNGINHTESRLTVLAEQFTRINQQAVSNTFNSVCMVMAAADYIETALAGQSAGQLRVVVKCDAPPSRLDRPMETMVGDGWKCFKAKRSYQMYVSDVITVKKMHRTVEKGQFLKHERRNQVAAMDEQSYRSSIAMVNGGPKVGDMIMTVGDDGDMHGAGSCRRDSQG